MREAKVFESGNLVRGFSLVLRDPEGSHYKMWGEKAER
jgi:hypothetical protein